LKPRHEGDARQIDPLLADVDQPREFKLVFVDV